MGRWLGPVALVLSWSAGTASTVAAATDLESLLAPPPSSNWAVPTSGTWMLGPFSAQGYGSYTDANSTSPGNAAANLNSDGFIGGFGDAWVDGTNGDQLVERVFEFRNSIGANDWFSGVKEASQRLKERRSDIAAATQIPDSFGVLLVFPDGKQWRVDFRKGDLVFIVHTNAVSGGDDLSALAVTQAMDEWNSAPANQGTVTSASPMLPAWLLPVGGGVIAAIFITTVGSILLIWVASRRRARPVAAVSVSPDGRYWWDGMAWRPTDSGSASQRETGVET